MSDHTGYTLQIFGLPVGEHEALIAALEGEFGRPDDRSLWWVDPANASLGCLLSLQWYEDPVGHTADMHKIVVDATNGRYQFRCWEDPKYEWLGEVVRYHPEFGDFTAECDANGTPQVSYDALDHALRSVPNSRLRPFLKDLIGQRWHRAWIDAVPHT